MFLILFANHFLPNFQTLNHITSVSRRRLYIHRRAHSTLISALRSSGSSSSEYHALIPQLCNLNLGQKRGDNNVGHGIDEFRNNVERKVQLLYFPNPSPLSETGNPSCLGMYLVPCFTATGFHRGANFDSDVPFLFGSCELDNIGHGTYKDLKDTTGIKERPKILTTQGVIFVQFK